MTYQSASGAGAQNMRELLVQMGEAHMAARDLLEDPASAILDIDREVAGILRDPNFPDGALRRAARRQPHSVDRPDLGDGMSREEWKGGAETNKILGRGAGIGQERDPGRFDLRAHRRDALPQPGAHDQAARATSRSPRSRRCSPPATTGCASFPIRSERASGGSRPPRSPDRSKIPIGRLRKLAMGGEYLGAFTVGDQLLWGAAEPLRRMVRILRRTLTAGFCGRSVAVRLRMRCLMTF